MMRALSPDLVDDLIRRGKAIAFCDDSPDNEYPGIFWRIVGIIESNEIVVLVKSGSLRLMKQRTSWLAYPAMADRIFGIDVADQSLAMELADEIWREHQVELLGSRGN